MATVKFGTIVTDIKGKVGGNVFQGSKSGTTLKTIDAIADSAKLTKADAGRVINTLPLTASIAGAWRNLTDAQRQSWVTGAVNYPAYNKFGVAYTPSGYQVFMTLNFQIVALGFALLTDCPVPVSIPDLPDFSMNYVPATNINLIFSIAITADFNVRVDATQPMAQGRKPKNSFYKTIAQLDSTATSPTDLYAAYTAVYGSVPGYAKLYFRLTYFSETTGQKGVPMIIELTT